MREKIAIFKRKEDILLAFGRGDIKIDKKVSDNPDFTSAAAEDLLGFIAESGSDYTITEVRKIKNDPKAFFELAFSKEVGNGETAG